MTIDIAWGALTWSTAKEIGIEVAGGVLTWIPQVNGDGICPRQINLGYQVNSHERWEMDGEREERCKTELCVILLGSICTQQPTTTTRSHSCSFPPLPALPQAWPGILDQASYASNQPKYIIHLFTWYPRWKTKNSSERTSRYPIQHSTVRIRTRKHSTAKDLVRFWNCTKLISLLAWNITKAIVFQSPP